jgi:excisionase family DNA binding protein
MAMAELAATVDVQRYVTTAEAAEALGLARQEVSILARLGYLPAHRANPRLWLVCIERRAREDGQGQPREWLTYAEAAAELGVTRGDIRRMVREGQLEGFLPFTGEGRLTVRLLWASEVRR